MFSRFFIDRPIFAAVLSVFLVLAGLASMRVLPVAQYPEIAPPVVTVTAVYPGASAQVLEQTVAAPLENQINGVEHMIYMASTSTSQGVVQIQVTFDIVSDADQAAGKIRALAWLCPRQGGDLGHAQTCRARKETEFDHVPAPSGGFTIARSAGIPKPNPQLVRVFEAPDTVEGTAISVGHADVVVFGDTRCTEPVAGSGVAPRSAISKE